VDRRVCSRPESSHRRMRNIFCIHNCLPEDEPKTFEARRRQQKLNINLENCAFRWFVLYIKMHGVKNIKFMKIRVPQENSIAM
jgi:hypothetical protein